MPAIDFCPYQKGLFDVGDLHMSDLVDFGFGTQIRKSPYFDATVKWGAQAFSVYNHMYIPRDFGDPEQNFWNLVNHAILSTRPSA